MSKLRVDQPKLFHTASGLTRFQRETLRRGGPFEIQAVRMRADAQRRKDRELMAKIDPDRKSTRLNSSHLKLSRMPSSA